MTRLALELLSEFGEGSLGGADEACIGNAVLGKTGFFCHVMEWGDTYRCQEVELGKFFHGHGNRVLQDSGLLLVVAQEPDGSM